MHESIKVSPEFFRVLSSKDPRIQLFLSQNQLHYLQTLPLWDLLSVEEQLFLQSFYYRKVTRRHVEGLIDPRQASWEPIRWCIKEAR